MSLFNTKIKVDLKPILAALPKGATIHHIGWDGDAGELVILWEHDKFHSGLTVPVIFTPEDLRRRVLPATVRDLSKKQPAPKPPVLVESPKPEAIPDPAARGPAYIRTEKSYDAAMADGMKLEFWGIESVWKPVDSEHEFTEGYMYREIKPEKVVDAAPVPA